MYYSYAMGIDASILTLRRSGFSIEADGENFMVSFPDDKAAVWEAFVTQKLADGYWNEYLTNDSVVFLFRLEGKIKKYTVRDYDDPEVLRLCEKLCARRFASIRDMLCGNPFYKDKLD